MDQYAYGFLAVVGLILLFTALVVRNQWRAAARLKELRRKFNLTELYQSATDGNLLGIDFAGSRILLGNRRGEALYGFHQLVSVEVFENGASITQTNRGSQVAGAVLGGLLFGGVGAIVGGLSGSSRTTARVREIALKIMIDDQLFPVHKICFFKAPASKGLSSEHPLVRKAQDQITRFHAHLLTVLRKCASTPAQPVSQQHSIEDTEEKLYRVVLLQKGGFMPVALLKVLNQELPELGRREINRRVLNAPSDLATGLSKQRADALVRAIGLAGGVAELMVVEPDSAALVSSKREFICHSAGI
jgi:hypothetical protein